MSVFDRISDLFQAKTHKILSSLENPDETLELSYEKMLAGLQETKRHLADVMTERTSVERQLLAARKEAEAAEDDARTALRANREDLARAALNHKQAALRKAETLEAARAAIAPQVEKLQASQRRLAERIEQFRTEKEVMKSTYAAAKSQVKVTESLTGIGSDLGHVGSTMRRAQDRVEQMQSRAAALEGMVEGGMLDDGSHANALDKELHQLRATGAVESDLERLRLEVGHAPREIEGKAE